MGEAIGAFLITVICSFIGDLYNFHYAGIEYRNYYAGAIWSGLLIGFVTVIVYYALRMI